MSSQQCQETITVSILGAEVEVDVWFNYTPAVPAITNRDPDECEEGSEAEFEITYVEENTASDHLNLHAFACSYQAVHDYLVEKLQELRKGTH